MNQLEKKAKVNNSKFFIIEKSHKIHSLIFEHTQFPNVHDEPSSSRSTTCYCASSRWEIGKAELWRSTRGPSGRPTAQHEEYDQQHALDLWIDEHVGLIVVRVWTICWEAKKNKQFLRSRHELALPNQASLHPFQPILSRLHRMASSRQSLEGYQPKGFWI